jgi:hypothetical protein
MDASNVICDKKTFYTDSFLSARNALSVGDNQNLNGYFEQEKINYKFIVLDLHINFIL